MQDLHELVHNPNTTNPNVNVNSLGGLMNSSNELAAREQAI
jgi:hypothetical protein